MSRIVPLSRRAVMIGGLAALPLPALAAGAPVVTMLGDSITAGFGLAAADALPAQLHLALLKLGVANTVRGSGVSGDTSVAAARRLAASVHKGTAVCVVALGGNDLLQGFDPKVTRDALDRIVSWLEERHVGVVLAGMTAPPQIGAGYARDFNAVFPEVAKKHGAVLYPDLLAGVGRVPALNQDDAIHPNARGVKIIAARLAPVVARALKAAR
jgi:acyl-CoA thioesterase-1